MKYCIGFLIALTLLRLGCTSAFELSPDEAYYHLWSTHLDWSYYSKGPGIAWIIRVGTALFGTNEFGIRFFAPIFALGTSLILLVLGTKIYNASVGIWTVVILNCTPIFQAGAMIMTIDAPSIFCWSATLLTAWLALSNCSGWRKQGLWCLVGVSVGVGFLCKYTNAVALISLILAVSWIPKFREEFKKPGIYLAILITILFAAPVLYWNSQHNWITVNHLQDHGKLNRQLGIHPGEFLAFCLLHLGVYSPLLFAGVIIALVSSLKSYFENEEIKSRFLLAFGVPLLAMYTLLALQTAGEPNWTAPAFISLTILTVNFWILKIKQKPQLARLAVASVALAALMSLLTLNTNLFRQIGFKFPASKDPANRLKGWKQTAKIVSDIANEERVGGLTEPKFIIGNKYQTAAILDFYLKNKTVFTAPTDRILNQYAFWKSYDSDKRFVGQNALYVTDSNQTQPPINVTKQFSNWHALGDFSVMQYGVRLRQIRIFLCEGLKD